MASTSSNREQNRLDTLHQFQLLNTEKDPDFDDLVALASELCETPISLATLVDANHTFIKSSFGIELKEVSRDVSFCTHTIQGTDLFVVPDLKAVKELLENSQVAEEFDIQFYAGMPLLSSDGSAIGALCILDHKPRELSERQIRGLKVLAKQAMALLELRLKNFKLDETNKMVKASEKRSRESEFALNTYFNSSNDAVLLIDDSHCVKAFNKLAESNTHFFLNKQLRVGESMLDYVQADRVEYYLERHQKALKGEKSCIETKILHGNTFIWWQITYLPVQALDSDAIVGVILKMENVDQRKTAEEALRQSKQLITDIADNLPNGVIFQYTLSADGQHGFPYVSSGASKLFGVSPEEITKDATLIFNLLYPDESRLVEAILYSKEHLTDFDLQYQILVNGEIKWTHTKSKPKPLPDGSVQWDGLTIEITEQKKIVELVEKTKQDLQAVVSTIPDLLFRIDKDNRYVFYHAGDSTDLYAPPEFFLGKRLEEVLPADFMQLLDVYLAKARNSKEIVVFEYNLDIPHVGKKWFEARMLKTEKEDLMMMIRNVTERKRTEAALQESEANLHTVFNNTEVGYFLLNAELTLLSFNKPAFLFTKELYQKELVIGSSYYDYFTPKDQELLKETMKEVLEGQMVHYDRSFSVNKEKNKWFYIRYSPISNKNDQVIGIVMSVENITDRKENEIELNRSLELVTEQNKRLLNFSYIVSHNLRSHTSNIKSILDLLKYVDTEEEKKDMIGILHNVSHVLDETIRDLSRVVSIHTHLNHTIESLSLKEYVEKTILVLGEQIVIKKAEIHNNVSEEVTVKYTSAYLDSVLLNFISNAIKYSHPTKIPNVSIGCECEGDKCILTISDNGIGIDLEKNGSKLFGMYKTFNGNADARGIGLFISKNQIEAMGGRVEVESELGKGTSFKIYMRKG